MVKERYYKMREFIKTLDDLQNQLDLNLTCKRCKNIMTEAVFLMPCGHISCKNCIDINHKTCF